MKRLKVLASAYACEPGRGSEPGVGWNYALGMAEHHDVWVLTRANNRQSITNEIEKTPVPGLCFLYYDLPRIVRWIKKIVPGGVTLYYFLWQIFARKVVDKAHAEINFDVAQHVTFAQYWMPSALQYSGIPYVYGPIGGGEYVPRQFLAGFSARGRIRERLRSVAQSLFCSLPCVQKASGNAEVVVAATELTATACRRFGAKQIEICSQVGIDASMLQEIMKIPARQPIVPVFACVGRLVDWKGGWIAAEAFCRANIPNSKIVFTAGGPDADNVRRIFEKHGMSDQVEFLGWVDRNTLASLLATMTALIFPSLRDSSGMVLVEAMGYNKPVVCFDWAGPGFITRKAPLAHRVDVGAVEAAIEDYSAAMRALGASTDVSREHCDISAFLFEKNIGLYCSLFEEIVSRTGRAIF